jgi:hypothetical protein
MKTIFVEATIIPWRDYCFKERIPRVPPFRREMTTRALTPGRPALVGQALSTYVQYIGVMS